MRATTLRHGHDVTAAMGQEGVPAWGWPCRVGRAELDRRFGLRSACAPEPEPVDGEAVFAVASLSKPPFAALVLRLAARGILNLDAPLAELTRGRMNAYGLDPTDERLGRITARHVLGHSSGLGNWTPPDTGRVNFRAWHAVALFERGASVPAARDRAADRDPAADARRAGAVRPARAPTQQLHLARAVDQRCGTRARDLDRPAAGANRPAPRGDHPPRRRQGTHRARRQWPGERRARAPNAGSWLGFERPAPAVPASVRLIAGSAPRDLPVAIARRGRRRGATRLGHRREQSQQPPGEVQRPAELDAAVGQAGERSAAHGRCWSR
jgi:hypothetical protein